MLSTDIVSKGVLKAPKVLVAPIEKQDVPNHLLNTKIYAKLKRNELFEVTPIEIHFAGFELNSNGTNRKYTQKLKIINISDEVQRLTILPPQSKYFDVFYVKPVRLPDQLNKIYGQAHITHLEMHLCDKLICISLNSLLSKLVTNSSFFSLNLVLNLIDLQAIELLRERLVPGFAIEVQITFKPDEYKYFSDSIRIHSKSEQNLIVPIHAYPIISSYSFPSEYKFPNVPIGKTVTRTFSLRSSAPIEFEYMIDILERHPSFKISPVEGIIPYDRDAVISVTFEAKEFCTAIMVIQLIVSQFNAKPIVCRFCAASKPGLERDQLLNTIEMERIAEESKTSSNKSSTMKMQNMNLIDPRMISPLHLSRLNKKNGKYEIVKNLQPQPPQQLQIQDDSDEIEMDGFRIPKEINSVWSVSKVLNQTKGKLRLKELIKTSVGNQNITVQHKEKLFLQKVLELEDEERKNQLKWQVKLGETSIDPQAKQDIIMSRAQAEYRYKLSIGEPVIEEELARKDFEYKNCRTIRPYDQQSRTDIEFDIYINEMWSLKHFALEKFIQVARKIIVRSRMMKNLNALKVFADEWLKSRYSVSKIDAFLTLDGFVEKYVRKVRGETIEQDIAVTSLTAKTLGTYYFPHSPESNESQNDTQLDSLGFVAVRPIEFSIHTQVPYCSLSIPQQYKLNDYQQTKGTVYVPKYENRTFKLRNGAEDEYIHADFKASDVQMRKPQKQKLDVNKVHRISIFDPKENVLIHHEHSDSALPQVIDLKPPAYLSQPVEYPEMFIFNPAPGLISYQKLLPYSSVDLNHHLNPLPRFEKDQPNTTQKKFIDREDVIKGIMSWKKFPSQGLISLSNTPTLTDVWVPRWSNVFGTDILPVETPALLSGLPEDDKENLLDDTEIEEEVKKDQSTNSPLTLTPEMVNTQFSIPQIFESRQQKDDNKLPLTNLPVSIHGPVAREQREQELEYYLNKQYNELGLRIKAKISQIQTENPSLLSSIQLEQSSQQDDQAQNS